MGLGLLGPLEGLDVVGALVGPGVGGGVGE